MTEEAWPKKRDRRSVTEGAWPKKRDRRRVTEEAWPKKRDRRAWPKKRNSRTRNSCKRNLRKIHSRKSNSRERRKYSDKVFASYKKVATLEKRRRRLKTLIDSSLEVSSPRPLLDNNICLKTRGCEQTETFVNTRSTCQVPIRDFLCASAHRTWNTSVLR